MNENKESASRPLGVIIIAILLVLVGLGGLVFYSLLWTDKYNLELNIEKTHINFIYLTLMSIFAVACGIGMWTGRKWGWWILLASYFSSIMNKALDFFLHINEKMTYRVVMDMTMDVVGILILLALISYFSEKHVLRYFELNPDLKTRYFLYLIPIGFVIRTYAGQRI